MVLRKRNDVPAARRKAKPADIAERTRYHGVIAHMRELSDGEVPPRWSRFHRRASWARPTAPASTVRIPPMIAIQTGLNIPIEDSMNNRASIAIGRRIGSFAHWGSSPGRLGEPNRRTCAQGAPAAIGPVIAPADGAAVGAATAWE